MYFVYFTHMYVYIYIYINIGLPNDWTQTMASDLVAL